jgi:hypothetical protein
MDPILVGALGLGAMFVLILLHVPIGVAMGITGVTSVAFIIGWEPALTLLGTEPSAAIENEGLAVVALFLLMGSVASQAGVSAAMSEAVLRWQPLVVALALARFVAPPLRPRRRWQKLPYRKCCNVII